ncbi:D-alanyl-D-alanine carboxypeptidase/D-alanyl-D-alanine endopeptidase [Sphingomonas sp.]|uniref:D-alanyl-D-alanine carboxypeptidase/D-alanyl-D-alanine endopeptidase n=1 Tax=Sphingomonas sp. TaxID=28214 RepID=UPI002B94B291|nr:D-alanyl-D-alanine carboxypeptidase/D-alanyl-D-alanine-endopeptidase [Sphingomonas sp.]HTG39625.1 D-alanyl-D-alanine carboxypeptidase/D-alanyl-D-alanine-endopeptidase [Sphingomonas sp.]
MRFALVLLALSLPLPPAFAMQVSSTPMVERVLDAGPPGTRYGLLVTTLEGEPVVSIAPDERFIPASNTKMFTTATAYADLPALDRAARGTGVRVEQGDVILEGHGDARLSSAADCVTNCLQTLADAVAARTRRVRNIVGDDSWFPNERWGPGMSWNNIQSRYGTGISALTLDDNEVTASVTPAAIGGAAGIEASPYYDIDNRVTTVPGKGRTIVADRVPNSRTIRLTGTIGAEAPAATLYFSIDDPAHYTAWRMRDLLIARGVKVSGAVMTRHRPLSPADDPAIRGAAPAPRPPAPDMLAELPPLPLAEDMRIINKQSQNLHADLMLRRVARTSGSGSIADGQAALDRVMRQAGVTKVSYTLADGSGMSSYNRITPRAAVTLLRWIANQPWGAAWRETLPIAGQDGTLRSRFKGTVLEGRLFAKTGSLNASRALSGYLVTKSGRTLVFSALANDMPDGTDAQASAAVDRALVALAKAM